MHDDKTQLKLSYIYIIEYQIEKTAYINIYVGDLIKWVM